MIEIGVGSTTHREATMDVGLQDATPGLDNGQALAGASTIPTGSTDDSINSTGNDSGRVQADLGGEATDGETTVRAVSCKRASMRNSCCRMLTLHKAPVISRMRANLRPLSDVERADEREYYLNHFWRTGVMHGMTDLFRFQISTFQINRNEVKIVTRVFEVMLDTEDSQCPVQIELIVATHFDKMLDEIVAARMKLAPIHPRIARLVSLATTLQHKFHLRFKETYFAIDDTRKAWLKKKGALHGLLPMDRDQPTALMWHVAAIQPPTGASLKLGRYVSLRKRTLSFELIDSDIAGG